MEWSNKVAASDRADAKLYPVISIDTSQYVSRDQKNKRRNSTYQAGRKSNQSCRDIGAAVNMDSDSD